MTATPSGSPPADLIIRTDELTKCYGETTAVDRLSLSVGRAEVFGLSLIHI